MKKKIGYALGAFGVLFGLGLLTVLYGFKSVLLSLLLTTLIYFFVVLVFWLIESED